MKVKCICGDWHEASPTALALIVSAYQDGDMQTIGKGGIRSLCIAEAFQDWRIRIFETRYQGNKISLVAKGVS